MRIIGKFFKSIIICLVVIIIFILKIPFCILYPTKIIGKKNLRQVKTGAVVAINHYSNFDIVYIMVKLLNNFFKNKYLGKRELSKCFIARWFLSSVGVIFITRGAVDRVAMKEVEQALKNNNKVIIFPEGTRNKTGLNDMQEIKAGTIFFARRANVPIVPVRMEHKARLFRLTKIYVGEPYFVGENGKLSTEEEVKILTDKFNSLITQNKTSMEK